MRICYKCKLSKDKLLFNKNNRRKDGLTIWCKLCCKIENKKHYSENSEEINNKYKNEYKLNKEKAKLNAKIYHKNNKKQRNLNGKIYRQNNKGICNASAAKYRAIKLQATPKWLTEKDFKEIEFLYTESQILEKQDNIKRHVDHIIPLQGKEVCGLHVFWNLRIITAEENLSKGNRINDID